MPPLCNQMQPTGNQIHPPGAKYQPLGSPVANQPAATQTPNSTRNAVMLQCSYGRKIMGAGGRGVSLKIRRAVLAQLLGVLGHMYNGLYTYL